MMSDLTTRILAIILAIFLWTYVRLSMREGAVVHRALNNIPVSVSVAPSWAYKLDQRYGTVNLTVKGPAALVNNLSRDDLEAKVDLSDVREARSLRRTVKVNLPKGVVSATKLPQINVTLVPLARKDFPITVSFITQPKVGAKVGEYLIQPDTVTVEGPADELDKVKYIVVRVDPTEQLTSKREFTPRAVDITGERIETVTMLTPTVTVRMASLTGEHLTRQVAVRDPQLEKLPRGYSVTITGVRPDVVTVSGDATVLDTLAGYVDCEPLDVHTLRSNGSRTTRLKLPPELTVQEGADVHVGLNVHPIK